MKSKLLTFIFLLISYCGTIAQTTIKRDATKDIDARRAQTAVKYRSRVITTYNGIPAEDLADLGYNYFWGENGMQENKQKGLSMLDYSAKMNCADAYTNLGDIYCDSESGMTNVSKGITYYNKAINLGDIASINSMGLLYLEGDVIAPDYNKAKYYFEMGDKKGIPASSFYLAKIYDQGLGVVQNINYAISLYQKSSSGGMFLADVELGKKYLFGEGVLAEYNKAYNYFNGVAQKYSYPEAVYWLARMTEEGLGCSQDKTKALQMYQFLLNNGINVTEDIQRVKK